MNLSTKTVEFAKVYEEQGCYKEALEIYSFLDKAHTSGEVQAGLKRMEEKRAEKISESDDAEEISKEKKISLLFEKWLNLMILKQKLNKFLRIKSQLS